MREDHEGILKRVNCRFVWPAPLSPPLEAQSHTALTIGQTVVPLDAPSVEPT